MTELSNPKHEQFARHLASGEMSATQAYAIVYKRDANVASVNASRLLKNARITARVSQLKHQIDRQIARQVAVAVTKSALETREKRLQHKEDRHERLRNLILARAVDENANNVAGGTTGLLTRKLRWIGGENGYQVEDWNVDGTVLSELRELEDSAARELGQLITGPVNAISLEVSFTPGNSDAPESQVIDITAVED